MITWVRFAATGITASIFKRVITIEEKWLPLIYRGETYDRLYVSNYGKVKNLKTNKLIKFGLNKRGYLCATISLGSRENKASVKMHRLVAEAFIPLIEGKNHVNHKDGNKINNRADNLEWCTFEENRLHAVVMKLYKGKAGELNPQSILSNEDVLYIRENCIRRDKEFGVRALARKFNIDHSVASDIINRKLWTHI